MIALHMYSMQRLRSKYATNKGVKCLNETNVTETMVNAKIFLDGGRMC